MRVVRLVVLMFCGLGAVLMMTSSTAQAHNTFVDSSPKDGETLAGSPGQWRVVFDKSVPLASASGSVVNGDGVRTSLAAPQHGETDSIIVFDLPPNLNGAVTTRWRLVGTDGHVISGRVSFVVNAPSSNAGVDPSLTQNNDTTSAGQSSTVIDGSDDDQSEARNVAEPFRVSLRLINYVALVLLGGLFFINIDVAQGALHTGAGGRILRWGGVGLAVAPLFQFMIFLNDISLPDTSMLSSVSDALATTAGSMLLLRAVIGAVIAAILLEILRRQIMDRATELVLGGAALMYLVSLAYVGHSRSQSLPIIGVPLNVVHTTSVAVWLGGLIVMIAVVNPLVTTAQSIAAFTRFSYAAQRAVVVIAATGVVQVLRLHGVSLSILTSGHGLLIVTKLCVVGAMLWLAAKNRRLLLNPAVAQGQHANRSRLLLVRATTTEVVAGALVLILTAILVAISPS